MHAPPHRSPAQPDPVGCGVCSAPAGDDGHLCRAHTGQLIEELATVSPHWEDRQGRRERVPGLAEELEVSTTRQDRIAAEKHGGRSASSPLPWNEHTSGKAIELNLTLNAWARDVSLLGEDERDPLLPIHHSETALLAEWLVRNIGTLRRHDEAGQAFHDLTDAISDGRRAIDRPPDMETFGPCKNPDVTPPCPEYLYALPGKDWVTCRGCGARHETEVRREWMRGQADGWMGTATEVAGYLRLTGISITPATVRAMADRGRIQNQGFTERGNYPLYRISDVIIAIGERYKRRVKAA